MSSPTTTTAATTSNSSGTDHELVAIGAIVGSIFAAGVLVLLTVWTVSTLQSYRQKQLKLRQSSVEELNIHEEPHFTGADVVRDIVVGLSDGLTVPFALTAGLSSLGDSRFVVIAGMAEIVAGCISMGLGGYLAGRSEIEHYYAEEAREWEEVHTVPEQEEEEIFEIFEPYGIEREDIQPLVRRLKERPEIWVEFMMKYELNLDKPDSSRLWISALTIGASYFMGGIVPLFPYLVISNANIAFYVSIGGTLVALFIFGYVKAGIMGVEQKMKSAFEMMIVGAAASGAAFGIAKAMPTPTA
ncbi:hypothetical protein HK100_003113 [Physocladia obscura]|uniref:DUF125-domain-containing protein n=1 Tax=Physocladia obscura TaxID=109957 RepID=A0AAD5SUD6_9FUNG|nr:hypothetical protein HK100_003113 [Physocladia obscura]